MAILIIGGPTGDRIGSGNAWGVFRLEEGFKKNGSLGERSMKTHIGVDQSVGPPVESQSLEIVERKGKGHPDTICDAIAESISIHLSTAYQHSFGRILHHNVDKCMLVAGQVRLQLGKGRVMKPMRLIIGGRASFGIGRKTLPVAELAIEAAQNWIKNNLPHVNPAKHMTYQMELQPTSVELGAIFERGPGLLPANDTSAGVGYAPFTPTEQLVLGIERYLNSSGFKQEHPETGQDVKVMGVRMERELSLTVAMPFLTKTIHSEKNYVVAKEYALQHLQEFIHKQPHGCQRVQVTLNALDRAQQGLKGMYLTLLGTSAEQGDSGQVGRGNRVCGLISLNRPMSVEAAAGKNPVSHVGKIYNVLAHQLAMRIHADVRGVGAATVWMVSRIGQPINRPLVVSAQVGLKKGYSLKRVSGDVQDLIKNELAGMKDFCDALAQGQFGIG
jgi:S-adenosylmethionine synthetase